MRDYLDLHRPHQPGLFHTDTKFRSDNSSNSQLNQQVEAWRTSSRPPTPSRKGTYSTSWSFNRRVIAASLPSRSRPLFFFVSLIPRRETKMGVGVEFVLGMDFLDDLSQVRHRQGESLAAKTV